MGNERFDVTTRLSTADFDGGRTVRVLLREVRAELRALRRADARLVRVRWRPERGPVVAVDTTIVAGSAWEAVEVATATVRTAIHAAGGATVGWDRFRPDTLPLEQGAVRARGTGRARRRGRAARRVDVALVRPTGTWAAAAQIHLDRARAAPPLPPFVVPGSVPELIDLR